MSPRFKGLWRPSLFKLMLMILLALAEPNVNPASGDKRTHHSGSSASEASAKSRAAADLDPMEPCYLSNNRASESLTISESTPVGTVVGEIMVNGDSSANGNIELSIRMPGGGAQTGGGPDGARHSPPGATQRQSRQTNGFSGGGGGTERAPLTGGQTTAKPARDLNSLIDLMPPLSIEHDTKRLILAKKLDRENLDRYIQAAGYQVSSATSSQSSSSSASLTVHIKCQLRDTNSTTRGISSSAPATTAKHSSSSSILIPIHLIVTDENDNWPVFVNGPYIVDLNESAAVGSPLAGNEIVAADADQQGPLSTIEYSIVAGSLWSDSFAFLNPLDSRSLVVKDNRLLDYESQPKITLRVMARDQGEPPNWAVSSLYVNLLDQDDRAPVFGEDKYLGYLAENRPGEQVELLPRRLAARDGDKTIGAPLVYSFHLKTNHSIHFELHPEVGRLTLKKSLPEEPPNEPLCLLIRATQADNPQRWSLTMAQIRLGSPAPPSSSPMGRLEQLLARGGDRQLPTTTGGGEPLVATSTGGFRFAQPNFTVQVSEAAPAGQTLLQLRATHSGTRREPDSTGVVYHLLDDEMGHFSLDQRSGRLSLNRSLDYELYRQLSVRVLATSEEDPQGAVGYPRLACDIARVTVNILAHNDYAPEFSHELYNFQLSVSDLIANFDLPKARTTTGGAGEGGDFDDDSAKTRGDSMTNDLRRRLTKRFGAADMEFSADELPEEPLAWPAMQLGQIYCADRDHGERLALQLIGSKANLFHLTQDGRLYLPLVNATSGLSASGHGTNGLEAGKQSELPAWSTRQAPTTSNQFAQSRFFPTRRSDHQATRQGHELPDRTYLNHLLGELSNLGRLRLKVLATDSGQPQQRQATALIVITVISIDNFILQRAPQLPLGGQQQQQPDGHSESDAIQLNNQTSYDTSRPDPNDGHDTSRSQFASQVMMIPATNGRSFVQINPDIISNLISQNTAQLGHNHSDRAPSPVQLLQSGAGSNSSSNGPGAGELQSESSVQSRTSARFQPPSLLLVDDDGAKFVAMPAAIKVYSQQVQEAAEQQQARQRSQLAADGRRAHEGSLWHQWKSQFGLGARDSTTGQPTGSLYWLNLSTAIMLHLIALVVVVSLVSRFRWPLVGRGGGRGGPGGSGGFGWPGRISRPSWPQGGREQSVASILNQASSNYGIHQVNLACSEGSESSSFGFPHTGVSSSSLHQQQLGRQRPLMSSQQQSSPTSSDSSSSRSPLRGRQQQSVSSGVVVSAVSNGYKLKSADLPDGQMDAKQQNLFGHLKLTLNKMLDSSEPDERQPSDGCVGQVSIRPLDSDSIKFENLANREAPGASKLGASLVPNAQAAESSAATQAETMEHKSRNLPPDNTTRSSTFVGQSAAAGQQETFRAAQDQKQVVSISVSGPKPEPPAKSEALRGHSQQHGSSSSSSVVSLVSMSSSISNKINAAVQQTGETATTGSDVSSLDSTTLFSGHSSKRNQESGGAESSSSGSGKHVARPPGATSTPKGAPPPPPPPPPPPCLVQVGGRLVIESLRQAAAKQAALVSTAAGSELDSGHLLTTSSPVATKPFSARPVESPPNSSLRRPLPQNPQHLRLRQQAVAGANQHSKGRQNGSSASSSTRQKQNARSSSREASSLQSLAGGKARPPTPPPLPNGQPQTGPSAKTVSPTTSVDRGYESFQSYTSASQQLTSMGRSSAPVNRGSRREHSSGHQQAKLASAIEGSSQRKLEESSSSFVPGSKPPDAGSGDSARLRRASQTLASGALISSAFPTVSQAHRLGGGGGHQRTSSSRRHVHPTLVHSAAEVGAVNCGQQLKRPATGRSAPAALKSVRPAPNLAERLNYEAEEEDNEDEDFYYCYNRLAATMSHHEQLAGDNPLGEYVSHAYLKGADACEFLGNQLRTHSHYDPPAQGRAQAGAFVPTVTGKHHPGPIVNGAGIVNSSSDLMLMGPALYHHEEAEAHSGKQPSYSHHHHHLHHHQHGRRSTSGRKQQQQQVSNSIRHHHSLYSAAAAAKKQLTWSDQVGVG